ncbi:MAG TPA: glycosyl hydrolase [Bacillota bacterium]
MEDAKKLRLPKTPLFRDPIYDGAADPTIIWNSEETSWWILYTNRRANVPSFGVSWVHGTDIGVASSTDGGQNWLYRGTVSGLKFEPGRNTFWAPEVIRHEGIYHMYVSYVKGVPSNWEWDREIIHYTSKDLWNWKFESKLKLSSDRVIDACVCKLPDGIWRMWYKDEVHNSFTCAADSKDLYNWEVVGPVITGIPHEGPNVFYWKGKYWMIADFWRGLMVQRSDDGVNWVRQRDILDKPGNRKDDNAYGQHPDILVLGDNAYIFYFTHPGACDQQNIEEEMSYERKRTSLQVAKLELNGDELVCKRDEPFDFYLPEVNC